MTPRSHTLDYRYRWLSAGIVAAFSLAFAIGLVFYWLDPDGTLAIIALQTGLVLLMASPAVRMVVATAERVRIRDVAFVVMTITVIVELTIVFWRASQ